MPALSYRFEITGEAEFLRKLKALGAAIIPAASAALHQEHEKIMIEAKKRTPVDTGALHDSGLVFPPEVRGRVVVSEGGFGGAAAPYAIYVHERLDLRHRVGQAKFYESALLESVGVIEANLAAALRAAIEGIR